MKNTELYKAQINISLMISIVCMFELEYIPTIKGFISYKVIRGLKFESSSINYFFIFNEILHILCYNMF